MSVLDPKASGPTITYRCSACARCFVALDEGVGDQVLCSCGAPLARGPLPRGIYELRSPIPVDACVTNPGQVLKDLDGGYSASHGYGLSHGGPTGPSDAPAAVPSTSPAAG